MHFWKAILYLPMKLPGLFIRNQVSLVCLPAKIYSANLHSKDALDGL